MRTREVHVAGRTIRLLAPADQEGLLERPDVASRFERDEYMPYWAELWPTALLLAEEVAQWESAALFPRAPTVLELGCGLGLVGLVVAMSGYRVTLSDYDADALAFAAENARRNEVPLPQIRHVDWREAYPEIRVDRILAADVLYETRNQRPVAEFVCRHLKPDGFALVGDPCRGTADAFERVARHCGLVVETTPLQRPANECHAAIRGRIFHLRRQHA